MAIKPTLFVGLGTTGTKILMNLRELMSEEYGNGGLPIFRYIAIETDAGFDVKNQNWHEDYEKIKVIRATIGDIKPIKHKLDPGMKGVFDPALANWLNPDVLKFAFAAKKGAGNIRMAGRLLLWENWDNDNNNGVWKTFADAHATVTGLEAKGAAGGILDAKGIKLDGDGNGDGAAGTNV